MGRFRKKMFGLNQGKKTTNTSTIPFELVDEEELSSIPSDVEAVLHALREATTVPSSTICVFFLSQVVAVLQNRAAVDHGLHKLENEGTILLIEIASMPALVFAEDWIKLVREQATSCNLGGIVMNRQNAIDIVEQFIECVSKAKSARILHHIIAEAITAAIPGVNVDVAMQVLHRCGAIGTPTDSGTRQSYPVCVPKIGPVVKMWLDGNKELMANIRRHKHAEASEQVSERERERCKTQKEKQKKTSKSNGIGI
eukprot:c17969_g1_i3.p1 GENE.c17969_g1_i3~~c17969_g1_i3.p1  ORF type:complete len:265 (+),score=47.00 c17969_g1_i3:32-796(+)